MKSFTLSIILCGLLFFLGLSYTIFQTPERHFEQSCQIAQKNLFQFEEEVNKLSSDSSFLNQLNSVSLSFDNLHQLVEDKFSLYIYQEDSLLFWSNSSLIPEPSASTISEDGELIAAKNGSYVGFKKDVGEYQVLALQLIKHSYPITNEYLKNEFSSMYPFDQGITIEHPDSTAISKLKNLKGEALFGLRNPANVTPRTSKSGMIAGILCCVAFWLVVFLLLNYFNKYFKSWTSFLILFIASILFIELIEFVNFEFKKSVLFGPELYASQYFGRSLGHLFFNSLILVFFNILIGVQYYLKQWRLKPIPYLVFSLWLLLQLILYNAVLKSLILDSVISFEINNFTLTTPYTFLGLSIISLLSAGLIISTYLWLHASQLLYPKYRFSLLLCFSVFSAVVLYYFDFELMAVIVPLILFAHNLSFYLLFDNTRYTTRFNHALNGLFFTSMIIASVLSYYNVKNDNFSKEIIANQLSKNRDLITEYRFEEIQKEIKKDPFFKKFFVSPFVSQKELQQRLNYLYFGGYLSKYNVSSTAFNLEGKPIKSMGNLQLDYYYDLINQEAEDTYSEWLFLVPQKDSKNSYLSILPIENDGKISGTLVLELSPKTYTKENLYPELLIEDKSSPVAQLKSSNDYEYAIYKRDYLVNQAGEYPFPYDFNSFQAPLSYPAIQREGKYKLNFYQIDAETFVVISDSKSSILIPISTFSYVFIYLSIFSIILFVLFYLFNLYTHIVPIKPFRFTFKNRINLSIALITIASLIGIGIVTIGYFSELYKANHTDKLIKKQQAVLSSLEYFITRENKGVQAEIPGNLATEIASMAEIQGIDINLFDINGILILSSQPGVFGNGLISKRINPLALHHVVNMHEERYIQDETIGYLNYQSVYVPVRLSNGEAMGILNLPYFAQEETLRKELSNLMVALVNVYILLLLVSIVVAFLISSSITRPLANISQKIGLISVSSKNEEIEWESDDEIGALVTEYNKMIVQIEESANALAQSERESAWREMARQIAHEIKNPLTPMKLGIQHLQRAINDDPDQVKELAERVSKTMIEQIENLSEIATAFSSFAKMPEASKEQVNLLDIIENVRNLFNQSSALPIQISTDLTEAWVMADKNQLLSVFNNLLKNAQQATEELSQPEIRISLAEKGDFYEVQVKDNGVGIAADKTNKVFVPNFTTKSSGTGLGLAISKQIVENSMGQIWFESEENKGSTFYVTLPKYKKEI